MCVVHTHVSKSVQNTVCVLAMYSCFMPSIEMSNECFSVKFTEYFMLLRSQMVNLYMPAEIPLSGHTRWVKKIIKKTHPSMS